MARNKKTVEEKYYAPFPSALRDLMKEKGKTQEEIAKEVGKTRQTISQYVNGSSEPSYDVLVKIADYLDVSIDYLLGRTGDPKRLPCAIDELGLSQNIVAYLKDPSLAMGRGDTVPKVNMQVHDFMNDIIEIAIEDGLFSEYQIMQSIISRFTNPNLRDNSDLLSAEEVMQYVDRNGLFVLPAKEGAAYYANQIGVTIGRGLIEKYVRPALEKVGYFLDKIDYNFL